MRRRGAVIGLAFVGMASMVAQEAPAVRFEVASVRGIGPFESAWQDYMKGGPGTQDPDRIMWRTSLSGRSRWRLRETYGKPFRHPPWTNWRSVWDGRLER